MLRINPTDMSEKDRYALGFFLDFMAGIKFKANEVYQFALPDKETHYTESKKIYLTHHLVKRPCKPNGKHPGEVRYEVIEQEIGSGSFAKVYKTLGTIVPMSQNNHLAYYKNKQRVAKWMAFTKKTDKAFLIQEYELTPSYMHMKPPVFQDDGGFLFMHYINGTTLANILNLTRKDNYFRNYFTAEKCLSLCVALAEALNAQVHANNIVHRDLKPENIIIKFDDATQHWVITFIDFGLSKKIETDDKGKGFGTPLYVSPESHKCLGTSFASDIYSLAVICSEVLGCNRHKFILSETDLFNEWFDGRISLTGIFKNIPGTDKLPQEEIKVFLETMSFSDSRFRPSAKQAAAKFKTFLKPTTALNPHSFFSSTSATSLEVTDTHLIIESPSL